MKRINVAAGKSSIFSIGVDQTAELIGTRYFHNMSSPKSNSSINSFKEYFSYCGLSNIFTDTLLKREICCNILMYERLKIFFRCANNPFNPDPQYSNPEGTCCTLKDMFVFFIGAFISLKRLHRLG